MLLVDVQLYDSTTQTRSTYTMSVETSSDWMFFFNHSGFNENLATPLGQPFIGNYENYNVTGKRYFGSVSYKSLDGVPKLANQTFAVVDPILSFDDTPVFQCDGVLGLGWSIESDGSKDLDQDVVPPIRNIIASSSGERDFYVLYVESPTQLPATLSFEIAFGQDIEQCGTYFSYTSLFYQRAADNGFLYFYLDGVQYGDHQLVPAGQTATVDSASPAIGMSFRAMLSILREIPYDFNHALRIFTTDCANVNTLKDLVFQIGGQEIAVPAYQYVADVRSII
ncbi:hypothetical protein M3Y99_00138000 [Aphelenchoides fujianensis]|nr:hypothetical protein M3Y99_00138000 [Aphelenchoides fujianensis]